MKNVCFGAALGLMVGLAPLPGEAQNVKITPVGSHPGELCANDRATIFEDPTGVRLLYDVGHTITGTDDPRLGDIHVVLLSHAHGDHIGKLRPASRTGALIKALKGATPHLAVSGRTMEFDGKGKCVSGC